MFSACLLTRVRKERFRKASFRTGESSLTSSSYDQAQQFSGSRCLPSQRFCILSSLGLQGDRNGSDEGVVWVTGVPPGPRNGSLWPPAIAVLEPSQRRKPGISRCIGLRRLHFPGQPGAWGWGDTGSTPTVGAPSSLPPHPLSQDYRDVFQEASLWERRHAWP